MKHPLEDVDEISPQKPCSPTSSHLRDSGRPWELSRFATFLVNDSKKEPARSLCSSPHFDLSVPSARPCPQCLIPYLLNPQEETLCLHSGSDQEQC